MNLDQYSQMHQTFDGVLANYLAIFTRWSSVSPWGEGRTAGLTYLSELSSLVQLDDFPDQLQRFVDRLTEDIKGVNIPAPQDMDKLPADHVWPLSTVINTFKFDLANDLRRVLFFREIT